jgi:cyanophycinase
MAKKNQEQKIEEVDEQELLHPSSRHKNRCPVPKGILIAVGGSENKGQDPEEGSNGDGNKNFIKEEILKRFVSELKGHNAVVAIVPTASTIPEELAGDYLKEFKSLGLSNVEVLDIRSRPDASRPDFLDLARRAKGFWFTGGDQLRLTALLGGTPLMHLLKERYTYERIIIGGTSAGAVAMSTPMIYHSRTDEGTMKGDLAITCGLEFIKDVAIDTHFIARGRFARIAQVVATNPNHLGLGLDENTGIVITEGANVEVIGSGTVTIIDGHQASYTNIYEISEQVPVTIRELEVQLLSKGQKYVLNKQDNLHL